MLSLQLAAAMSTVVPTAGNTPLLSGVCVPPGMPRNAPECPGMPRNAPECPGMSRNAPEWNRREDSPRNFRGIDILCRDSTLP
jgi:hypothetical protein